VVYWRSIRIPYGQEAELILVREQTEYVPDVVYVFGTETVKKANWKEWCGWCYRENKIFESKGLGIEPRLQNCLPSVTTIELVTIQDDLESLSQWQIFESLVSKIEDDDELVIDITHGYRVTQVILSSALHFLRLTKHVTIKHVFYAAFETREQRIIDYIGFYDIQDLIATFSPLLYKKLFQEQKNVESIASFDAILTSSQ